MFFRMIRVFVLLLPVSLALRKDRKKWIKKEYGPEYTLKAQKNARKLMNYTRILGSVSGFILSTCVSNLSLYSCTCTRPYLYCLIDFFGHPSLVSLNLDGRDGI